MSTYDYQSLCRDIHGMERWQMTAITSVCSEKIARVVRFLALPQTWEIVQQSLEFAWKATAQKKAMAEKAGLLMGSLEATPEWQIELPDSFPFEVANLLSFSRFALAAAGLNSVSEPAQKSLSLILEIADVFDLAAGNTLNVTAPAISLVAEEESSQQAVVKILQRHDRPTPRALTSLRKEAMRISDLFEKGLPAYCYHRAAGLIRASK